jgi:hypothetical protein
MSASCQSDRGPDFANTGRPRTHPCSGDNFLLCPGNHDCFAFDGSFADGSGHIHTDARSRYARDFVGHRWQNAFPHVWHRAGVAFVGLDTYEGVFQKAHSFDASLLGGNGLKGDLGSAQLAALREKLTSSAVVNARHRIVYLHNPIKGFIMGMRFKKELEAIFKEAGVTAILCGQTHKPLKEANVHGAKWLLNGGASTQQNGAEGPLRVLDLSGKALRFEPDLVMA